MTTQCVVRAATDRGAQQSRNQNLGFASQRRDRILLPIDILNPPRDFHFPTIPTVPTFLFATASKKQQPYQRSVKKVSGRVQNFCFCSRPYLCLLRRNFCVVIINVCGKFYTSHRLTVTSCHHRNLTSAGLPAGRAFCTEVSLSPLSVIALRKQ